MANDTVRVLPRLSRWDRFKNRLAEVNVSRESSMMLNIFLAALVLLLGVLWVAKIGDYKSAKATIAQRDETIRVLENQGRADRGRIAALRTAKHLADEEVGKLNAQLKRDVEMAKVMHPASVIHNHRVVAPTKKAPKPARKKTLTAKR